MREFGKRGGNLERGEGVKVFGNMHDGW
jgi:hypothetical protein